MNLDEYRWIKKLLAEVSAPRPGFDPKDDEAAEIAVEVKGRALADLPFEATKEAIIAWSLSTESPWIRLARDVRLPVLRAFGCLAPPADDAWAAVTAYLAAPPHQHDEHDLHPLIREAFTSPAFSGEVVYDREGRRKVKDSTHSRRTFMEVYKGVEARYNKAVAYGNAAEAIERVRSAPPVPLLATPARSAIESAEAERERIMAEWEATTSRA